MNLKEISIVRVGEVNGPSSNFKIVMSLIRCMEFFLEG